jgi:serine/threonine-protein kinase RsbT
VHRELEAVGSILERYMSNVNARALITRALQEKGLSPHRVTRAELAMCSTSIRRGVELFVSASVQKEVLQRLAEFFGNESAAAPRTIELKKEADISTARSEARRMCENACASAFALQKVITIVSELARNIVLYAKEGTIQLAFSKSKANQIIVTAIDKGPGIPNLAHIMGGQYQSRTGLGKGLLGTKRLAEHFEINTGAGGTTIVAEVKL